MLLGTVITAVGVLGLSYTSGLRLVFLYAVALFVSQVGLKFRFFYQVAPIAGGRIDDVQTNQVGRLVDIALVSGRPGFESPSQHL